MGIGYGLRVQRCEDPTGGHFFRSSGRGSEMAKSMAASLTAAVRRGYDAARRCDGYGSHACCDPRAHTAPALEALYDRAVRYRAGVWVGWNS